MKNKNRVLKTCLTALALSVAGLANADPVEIDLLSYSVISGAAVNIAAQPQTSLVANVGGHLAAQAAVTIGAYTTAHDIYAGAAVTTGAWSQVKQIHTAAAAGVGANATAQDVTATAAVVVGANGNVGDIIAGAAITLGAGATYYSTSTNGIVTEGAGSKVVPLPTTGGYTDDGVIVSAAGMTAAMAVIDQKFLNNPAVVSQVKLYTGLSGDSIIEADGINTFYYSAINLPANTTLTIEGDVTVITSEAMTMGAGAEIVLGDGATVTWILGGPLNLGAGSKFHGETYVKGAVNGATSDVCGSLYATGAVSVQSIGGGLCPTTGVFIDSAVEGLHYVTATQSGTTNSSGEYNYIPGETVTFSIGGIVLGTTPASGVVTPLSIVPNALSADNVQVNNIVRFLLSLDIDGDPSNGISISSDVTAVAADVVVDFSANDLSVEPGVTQLLATNLTITLVDATTAQDHFNQSLALLEAEPNTVWGNLQWGSGTWSSGAE
jgi:hypothetical protein